MLPGDEWCVEAFMDIDYTRLSDSDFRKTLKAYVAYAFTNDLIDHVLRQPLICKNLALDIPHWKYFIIGDYFDIFTGSDKPKEDDENATLVNSIENQTTNNGTKGKIKFKGKKIFKNFISMVSIGEGGHAFYHKEAGAIFTRVKALCPKFDMNPFVGLFLVPILNLEKVRYSYGRVLDANRLKNTKIKLPANSTHNPNWQFMEDYVKSLPYASNLL